MSEPVFVAVDADCPGCGWPERRVALHRLSRGELVVFECRQCDYASLSRDS